MHARPATAAGINAPPTYHLDFVVRLGQPAGADVLGLPTSPCTGRRRPAGSRRPTVRRTELSSEDAVGERVRQPRRTRLPSLLHGPRPPSAYPRACQTA